MGKWLIDFYKNKIKTEHKIAFFSTFILMLLIHLYLFTNNIPSEDAVFNYYHNQNLTTAGRWALSFFCSFSSYFRLTWFCGLLASIYVSLTTVVLVELFRIKNPIVIILVGGILASSNFISDTMRFIFTADGYMIAMLLSTLAVYLTRIEEKRILRYVVGGILICLACGIYQSYVPFAVLLVLYEIIEILLEGRYSMRDCFFWGIKQFLMFLFSMVVYYLIWKLCLHFCDISSSSYLGISDAGKLGLGVIVKGFLEVPLIVKNFFFADPYTIRFTPFNILNIIFLILIVLIILNIFIKYKIYEKKWTLLLFSFCIFLMLPIGCIWNFASDSIGVWRYWPRMLGSYALFYIFVLILYEKHGGKILKNLFMIAITAIIFNNSVMVNVLYFCSEEIYKKSYATALEMTYRIHNSIGEYMIKNPNNVISEIVFVGTKHNDILIDWYDYDNNKKNKYTNSQSYLFGIKDSLIWDGIHAYLFVNYNFDVNFQQSWDISYRDSYLDDYKVKEMGVWPAKDSVAIIDNKIIVKISNTKESEV